MLCRRRINPGVDMSHPVPESDSKSYPSIRRTIFLLVFFSSGILPAAEPDTDALAAWLLREQIPSASPAAVRPAVDENLRLLADLLEAPELALLETFKHQIGHEVEVELRSRTDMVIPQRVEYGVIYAERSLSGGTSALELKLSDLSFREILKRCALLPPPRNFLLGGWVYLRTGQEETAAELFRRSQHPLGESLANALEQHRQQTTVLEREARVMELRAQADEVFELLLYRLRLHDDSDTAENRLLKLRRRGFEAEELERLHPFIADYRRRYAEIERSEFQRRVLDIVDASVPNLPLYVDEGMLEEALEKLRARNPVGTLEVRHMEIVDSGLVLDLSNNRQLQDVSPLASLPLVSLNLSHTLVADLTPLLGTPLRELNVENTRINSLNVFQGFTRLRKLAVSPIVLGVDFSVTQGRILDGNLEPLSSLPLVSLKIVRLGSSSHVLNLSPLSGGALEHLHLENLAGKLLVEDSTRLPRLKHLHINGVGPHHLPELTGLHHLFNDHLETLDLSFVRPGFSPGMLRSFPLTRLRWSGIPDPIDLPSLKGMSITSLDFSGSALRDLSPFSGLPLEFLDISSTSVRDLTPLSGMPLRILIAASTEVDDLSALSGSLMERLILTNTKITSLAPLRGLPLQELDLRGTGVQDTHELGEWTIANLKMTTVRAVKATPEIPAQPGGRTDSPLTVAEARAAYTFLLDQAGIGQQNPDDHESVHLVLRKARLSERHIDFLERTVKHFRERFTDTAYLQEREPLLRLLEHLRPDIPLYFDDAMFQTLVENLQKSNPHCDLKIRSVQISDTGYTLDISRNPGLTDLTPLSGTPLRGLAADWTDIATLRPLRGLPLQRLSLLRTRVDRLDDLRHLPLLEDFAFSKVHPVHGIPHLENIDAHLIALSRLNLKTLRLSGLHQPDLTALIGLPLETLRLEGVRNRIASLAPLAGLPLRHLTLTGAEDPRQTWRASVGELSSLRACPLESVHLRGLAIDHLNFLKGTRPTSVVLTMLDRLQDIAPLREMPLETLDLSFTAVSDLGPLSQMPLQSLNISNTRVMDLSPLKTLPLKSLNIQGTPVESLEPLSHIPTLEKLAR